MVLFIPCERLILKTISFLRFWSCLKRTLISVNKYLMNSHIMQFRSNLLQTGWQRATRARLNRLKRDQAETIGEYADSNARRYQVEFRDDAGNVTMKSLRRWGNGWRWQRANVAVRQRSRRRVAERRRLRRLNQRDRQRVGQELQEAFNRVRIEKVRGDRHTFRISKGRAPFSRFTVVRVNVRLLSQHGYVHWVCYDVNVRHSTERISGDEALGWVQECADINDDEIDRDDMADDPIELRSINTMATADIPAERIHMRGLVTENVLLTDVNDREILQRDGCCVPDFLFHELYGRGVTGCKNLTLPFLVND